MDGCGRAGSSAEPSVSVTSVFARRGDLGEVLRRSGRACTAPAVARRRRAPAARAPCSVAHASPAAPSGRASASSWPPRQEPAASSASATEPRAPCNAPLTLGPAMRRNPTADVIMRASASSRAGLAKRSSVPIRIRVLAHVCRAECRRSCRRLRRSFPEGVVAAELRGPGDPIAPQPEEARMRRTRRAEAHSRVCGRTPVRAARPRRVRHRVDFPIRSAHDRQPLWPDAGRQHHPHGWALRGGGGRERAPGRRRNR